MQDEGMRIVHNCTKVSNEIGLRPMFRRGMINEQEQWNRSCDIYELLGRKKP